MTSDKSFLTYNQQMKNFALIKGLFVMEPHTKHLWYVLAILI